MTILEKIKFEEDWLSEVNLTKENINIAFAGIRATALEQQPKTGHWKPLNYKDEMWGYVYKCSNCGHIGYGNDYCPNCGADMRGEAE